MKRQFLRQLAALAACAAAHPLSLAQAADWPAKPIRLLVPFPPGGALDPVARAVGQRLAAVLGQPVVVDNRPGANTAIAAGAVAKAEPDGYTLLFTSVTTHVIHTLQAPRGYDSIKDFAHVAAVSRGDFVMAIHPSIPANTLPEFIAYGKANPDRISAGAGGSGNAEHVAAEMFKLATGVNVTTIPYKGSGPALVDLLAGRTQMMITSQSLVQAQIDAGKLRLLAFTYQPAGKPPVPTFAQYGLKDFDKFGLMNIILAPAATPAPVVAKLTAAIERVLEMPDTKGAIAAVNQTAHYLPPPALRNKLTGDSALFAEIIRKADIKFD
jgi:tripartite-type tricarboxylate transporter receptor subunit TctC